VSEMARDSHRTCRSSSDQAPDSFRSICDLRDVLAGFLHPRAREAGFFGAQDDRRGSKGGTTKLACRSGDRLLRLMELEDGRYVLSFFNFTRARETKKINRTPSSQAALRYQAPEYVSMENPAELAEGLNRRIRAVIGYRTGCYRSQVKSYPGRQ
jgi:hypothetical protein